MTIHHGKIAAALQMHQPLVVQPLEYHESSQAVVQKPFLALIHMALALVDMALALVDMA